MTKQNECAVIGSDMSPEPLKGDRLFSPRLEEIAERLSHLSDQELRDAIEKRLRLAHDDLLPGLGRDEDPSDILIDSYKQSPEKLGRLRSICASLAIDEATKSLPEIEGESKYVSELVYTAAMIGAKETIPAIADLGNRKELSKARLPSGEDLQSFALRCLSGLLWDESMTVRDEYRHCYESALEDPNHAAIALTTLSRFWPDDRQEFIAKASRHDSAALNRVIENLDRLLGTE